MTEATARKLLTNVLDALASEHVRPEKEDAEFTAVLCEALERARAYLAQPEPAGPTVLASVQLRDREFNYPSDVVLRQYCDDWFNSDPERSEVDPVDLCRGAIRLFAQAPVPSPDD